MAGQVGLTSVIVPLVVTFVKVGSLSEGVLDFALIVGALGLLWLLTTTRIFNHLVDRSVKFALRRSPPFRHGPDQEVLLRLDAGYTVSEVVLRPDHPG